MINHSVQQTALRHGSASAVSRRAASPFLFNLLISGVISVLVLIAMVFVSPQLQHWFILPVLMCGILIGSDAVAWFRGQLDIFDPIGIVGLFGYHFFFLAPMLQVYWSYWPLFNLVQPPDYRPWLGLMAVLNFLGILIYRFARRISLGGPKTVRTVWQLNPGKLSLFLPIALVVTALLQIWLFKQYGGIGGYVKAYEEEGAKAFEGKGWFFAISECFPILAMIGYATLARNKPVLRAWGALALAMVIFFLLQFLFAGLRGSRSSTIFAMFWALGIIHFWVRPLPRRVTYVGIAFLLVFMYVYRFYKHGGVEGLQALQSTEVRSTLERYTGSTMIFTLLVDLGRSDIQAYMLYKIYRPQSDYQMAWGRTYFGAVASLVPRAIWPNRPPTKMMEGTQILTGRHSYHSPKTASVRVYGLAGETMLNFGAMAVPFMFVLVGLAVGHTRRAMMTLRPDDSRLLLYPFLCYFCFIIITADSDNLLFFLMKNGLLPLLIISLSSRRFVYRVSGISAINVVAENDSIDPHSVDPSQAA
jgi:hypothetical protein